MKCDLIPPRQSKFMFDGVLRMFCAGVTGMIVLLQLESAKAQAFRWNLDKGDQFKVVYTQASDSTTTVTEKTTVVKSKIDMEMSWDVTSLDSQQQFVIEQSISSIRLSVGDPSRPEKSVSFDTQDPNASTGPSRKLLKQISPLVGLKFVVTMDQQGQITQVTLPKETQDVLQKLPGSLPLQALFSEKGIKELLGPSAIVFPKEEISPGSDWNQQSNLETAFGPFNRVRTYTLLEESPNDRARFQIATSIEPANPTEGEQQTKMMEFDETGELTFNKNSGYVESFSTQGTTSTELPYREKTIKTQIKNMTKMSIEKL